MQEVIEVTEQPRRRRGRAKRTVPVLPKEQAGDFAFTAPDRGGLWLKLSLNASQVAALCGVTLRQVLHWASRGYLPHAPNDPTAFSGHAVDMCLLIKEARSAGISHVRAVEQAKRFLDGELRQQGGSVSVGAPDFSTIAARLREIEQQAHELRAQLEARTEASAAD